MSKKTQKKQKKTSNKPTTIKLLPKEVAIVFTEDGKTDLYFPLMDPDDVVPDHALIAAKLVAGLKDESVVKAINKAWKKSIKKVDKELLEEENGSDNRTRKQPTKSR